MGWLSLFLNPGRFLRGSKGMSFQNIKSLSGPEIGRLQKIQSRFRELFSGNPMLVRSPGRVNLIGEHTDYNEGFVLPAAVDKAIYFAIAPGRNAEARLHAADLDESHVFNPSDPQRSEKRWSNYLVGVAKEFQRSGRAVPGFDCVFGGDIPIGSGMSSSAAIEAGLAFALNELFGLGFDRLSLVKLAQRAENEFVGVRCGIMDQFINIFGRPKSVLKLDCRSLDYAYFPFERDDLRIVLCDTMVRRELASSEYNIRRQQCESGVRALSRYDPTIKSLRDVSLEWLELRREALEPVVFMRCAYVLKENRRVEESCTDLIQGDFASFGARMNSSHDGLRDEYEVSCRELDALVEAARTVRGVLGARMMGAGFGGCTINLVEEGGVAGLREAATEAYLGKFGRKPEVYISNLSAGTEVIERPS
jgi:galactokinase